MNRSIAAGAVALACAALSACGKAPVAAPSSQTSGSTTTAPAASAPLTPAQQAAIDATLARNDPSAYLKLTKSQAHKGGFDTVFILSGTIKNNSPVSFKDPIIGCDLYSETQTHIGQVIATLYKAVPPHKSIRFTELNMGFAPPDNRHFSCMVMSATSLS